MNKRGFLLGEETVKIILSVIVILFLIAFVVYLYTNYSHNQNLTFAQDSLNQLTSEISSESQQVEIYNPSNWIIASFPSVSTSGVGAGIVQMPEECSSVGWKSCICIYNSISNVNIQGSSASFSLTGICQQSSFVVNGQISSMEQYTGPQQNAIKITPPLVLSINYSAKTIQVNG